MLSQGQAPASAIAPSDLKPGKLVRLIRKRLRQLAVAAVALAVILAVAAGGVAIWWLTSLNGLLEIGDPFDVAAFQAIKIPDDTNAFTYYRRASEALTKFPAVPPAVAVAARKVAWSQADPKLREWVTANGAALRWLLTGADQADGIFVAGAEQKVGKDTRINGQLATLALLEGGRREEVGDMAGAWAHYRAVLRLTAQSTRWRDVFERFETNVHLEGLSTRMDSWATDPKTTIAQLRLALNEALETASIFDSDLIALKREYVDIMRLLDDPNGYLRRGQYHDLIYRFGDMQLPPNMAARVYRARQFLRREPERSRRVLRLLFANWLAWNEIPPEERPRPAVKVELRVRVEKVSLPLYPASPHTPAKARALTPQQIAEWLLTTHDAQEALGPPIREFIRRQERRTYRSLVLLLASEIYRRERGPYPPTDQALVGTYLKRLPDDPSDDSGQAKIPTVSEE